MNSHVLPATADSGAKLLELFMSAARVAELDERLGATTWSRPKK